MIRASNLSKFYGGKRALGPVSFEINDGETVGFLGLNGMIPARALRCEGRRRANAEGGNRGDVPMPISRFADLWGFERRQEPAKGR